MQHLRHSLGIKSSAENDTVRTDKEYARRLDDPVFPLHIRFHIRVPQMNDPCSLRIKSQLVEHICFPRFLVIPGIYGIHIYRKILLLKEVPQ